MRRSACRAPSGGNQREHPARSFTTSARPWYKDAIYYAIDIESFADPDGERHAKVISTEPLRMHLTGHGHCWLRVAPE